jgi:hypothetical protein
MSIETGQNLGNHVKMPTTIIAVFLLGLIAIVSSVISLFSENLVYLKFAVLILSLALPFLAFVARTYCTGLQDRIIRTEMKIRLRDVLDADLAKRAESELRISQLVGLRFASDAELPELVAKVLDEKIGKGSDIKKLVTDWQGDYHRV